MRKIKKFFRSIAVAFSIYSRIPMPSFVWDSDDMKYDILFFPWVGACIGLVMFGWYRLCTVFNIGILPQSLIFIAIPLVITGGFHLDGFMDTEDALRSYKDKDEKLRIMADPHIGAFSIIALTIYMLFLLAAFSIIQVKESYYMVFASFFLVRCFSAFSVLTMKSAKENGMLKSTKKASNKSINITFIVFQAMIFATVLMVLSFYRAFIMLLVLVLRYIIYNYRASKHFDGTTGDLAGHFLCMAELDVVVVMAICDLIKIAV